MDSTHNLIRTSDDFYRPCDSTRQTLITPTRSGARSVLVRPGRQPPFGSRCRPLTTEEIGCASGRTTRRTLRALLRRLQLQLGLIQWGGYHVSLTPRGYDYREHQRLRCATATGKPIQAT